MTKEQSTKEIVELMCPMILRGKYIDAVTIAANTAYDNAMVEADRVIKELLNKIEALERKAGNIPDGAYM
jgi:hypothetical protein